MFGKTVGRDDYLVEELARKINPKKVCDELFEFAQSGPGVVHCGEKTREGSNALCLAAGGTRVSVVADGLWRFAPFEPKGPFDIDRQPRHLRFQDVWSPSTGGATPHVLADNTEEGQTEIIRVSPDGLKTRCKTPDGWNSVRFSIGKRNRALLGGFASDEPTQNTILREVDLATGDLICEERSPFLEIVKSHGKEAVLRAARHNMFYFGDVYAALAHELGALNAAEHELLMDHIAKDDDEESLFFGGWAFNAARSRLAVTGSGHRLRVVDMASKEIIGEFVGNEGMIMDVAWADADQTVVVSSSTWGWKPLAVWQLDR